MSVTEKIVKVVLPMGTTTGVVCGTMYLTNQANTTLDSISPLNIEEMPKIKEPELKPKEESKPPQKKQETNSGGSGGGAGQGNQQSQGGTPPPKEPSSPSNPQTSQSQETDNSITEQNKEEIIKKLIQEIRDKHMRWSSPNKSLIDFHEIISRTSQLKIALENLPKTPQK